MEFYKRNLRKKDRLILYLSFQLYAKFLFKSSIIFSVTRIWSIILRNAERQCCQQKNRIFEFYEQDFKKFFDFFSFRYMKNCLLHVDFLRTLEVLTHCDHIVCDQALGEFKISNFSHSISSNLYKIKEIISKCCIVLMLFY